MMVSFSASVSRDSFFCLLASSRLAFNSANCSGDRLGRSGICGVIPLVSSLSGRSSRGFPLLGDSGAKSYSSLSISGVSVPGDNVISPTNQPPKLFSSGNEKAVTDILSHRLEPLRVLRLPVSHAGRLYAASSMLVRCLHVLAAKPDAAKSIPGQLRDCPGSA